MAARLNDAQHSRLRSGRPIRASDRSRSGRWMKRSEKRGDRWRQSPLKKCHGAVNNDPHASIRQHRDQPERQLPCRSLPSYVSRAREATAGRSGGDKQARPSNIRRRRFGRTSPTTKCRGRLNRNPASVPRSAAPPVANRGRVHPSQAAARAGACHRTDRHVARAATTERKGTRVFIS
jgi:hypothetical protein